MCAHATPSGQRSLTGVPALATGLVVMVVPAFVHGVPQQVAGAGTRWGRRQQHGGAHGRRGLPTHVGLGLLHEVPAKNAQHTQRRPRNAQHCAGGVATGCVGIRSSYRCRTSLGNHKQGGLHAQRATTSRGAGEKMTGVCTAAAPLRVAPTCRQLVGRTRTPLRAQGAKTPRQVRPGPPRRPEAWG